VLASAVAALALVFGTTQAAAQHPAPLPTKMPSGYTLEPGGAQRWVYASSIDAEVTRLKRVQRETWARLGRELGADLGQALDLRVAINPEQMQALAPPGRKLPDYATGVAFPADGLILLSMTEPESWLRADIDRVLVHELAHVALHRAVAGMPVPRWFSEGVAIHAADEHSIARVRVLWSATLRRALIPLAQLEDRFPARHGEVSLAYAQSADLVGQLLQEDRDQVRFRKLVAGLRSGASFEQAFAQSYQIPLWQLEREWRGSLAHRFGSWPSLLSGLTVVWALAALLLVFGYFRVRQRHRSTLKRWAIEEAPVLALVEATPPPTPSAAVPRNAADDVLDAWTDQQRKEAGVPTIVHEGRSYTLH
jgi:hypothetical protein